MRDTARSEGKQIAEAIPCLVCYDAVCSVAWVTESRLASPNLVHCPSELRFLKSSVRNPMRDFRVSSMVIGVLVDKLSAVVSISVLMVLLGASTPAFQQSALVAGFLCTTFGAYVAARHARLRPVFHGAAVGLIALLISVSRFALSPLFASPDSSAAHSMTWEAIAWTSVVVAGLIGGLLAARSTSQPASNETR